MQSMDIHHLPNDPTALKTLLVEQAGQLQNKDTQLQNKDTQLQNQHQQLAENAIELRYLREQVNLLLHKRFAASSEKYRHPGQHELFDEVEDSVSETVESDADTNMDEPGLTVTSQQRKKPGRKPLAADLPRVRVVYDLKEDEKICPHDGTVLHKIGEDVLEQLEIIPASVRVIQHVRCKYACRCCETGITTAAMPPSSRNILRTVTGMRKQIVAGSPEA